MQIFNLETIIQTFNFYILRCFSYLLICQFISCFRYQFNYLSISCLSINLSSVSATCLSFYLSPVSATCLIIYFSPVPTTCLIIFVLFQLHVYLSISCFSYLFIEFDKFWLEMEPRDIMEFNRKNIFKIKNCNFLIFRFLLITFKRRAAS